MIRLVAAALLTAAAVSAVPVAAADPEILVPGCTGQVAQAGACVANPFEGLLGDAPGANPNVPAGLTPLNQPLLVPLGLTPQDFPVVLPLGVTPPSLPQR